MKHPCIVFKLGPLVVSRNQNGSEQVFRAITIVLGVVKIRTMEELSRFDHLYLVHPIRFPLGGVIWCTSSRHDVAPVAFTHIVDGQADTSSPACCSPETTVRCIVVHADTSKCSHVQEGRFGDPGAGRRTIM
ncbi:hypothetical protein L210DRAFT_1008262 [Boletus edulis BED1]|uniref:Uncharacterized protein n=1 Tax=Boletus edulis BED1 TaxID=1328754 RepID=A0AAD4G6D8_BOLED|nr:hypothetical protein L210DRAFT_1008262 [Boletus edulis BED1]